jgi:hypothetical protein
VGYSRKKRHDKESQSKETSVVKSSLGALSNVSIKCCSCCTNFNRQQKAHCAGSQIHTNFELECCLVSNKQEQGCVDKEKASNVRPAGTALFGSETGSSPKVLS